MSLEGSVPAVLFVCLGNVIRSPTCEGLLRTRVTPEVTVDSAAVTEDDIGCHPRQEVCRLAREHGYDISRHVARLVTERDYKKYNIIVSLEPWVFRQLKSMAPRGYKGIICEFVPGKTISNPWCGSRKDFLKMYGEIEAGMTNFIEKYIPKQYRKQ